MPLRWVAFPLLVSLITAGPAACKPPPVDQFEFGARQHRPACVRRVHTKTTLTLCPLAADAELFSAFQRGRWLPTRELRFRNSLRLQYGNAPTPVVQREQEELAEHGSYVVPYLTTVSSDLAGWVYYNGVQRLTMLTLNTSSKHAVVITRFDSDSEDATKLKQAVAGVSDWSNVDSVAEHVFGTFDR